MADRFPNMSNVLFRSGAAPLPSPQRRALLRTLAAAALPGALAACGGGGGNAGGGVDPAPQPVRRALPGSAVMKVRAFAGGWVALAEKLRPLANVTTPERHLLLADGTGAQTATYRPPEGWSLLDFAVHPSTDISAVLGTNRAVRLVRLDRLGRLLAQADFADPLAATDPYMGDPLQIRDSGALLPYGTRDAARLAALGEDVVMALRTGRNAVLAYRLRQSVAGVQTGWRTLVEPGVAIGAIGLTSGTFDPFGGLDNQWQVFLDVDAGGAIAIAVNLNLTELLEGHGDYFGQALDPSVTSGALVTRLDAGGRRIGATLIDTVQKSEIHALRWIDGRVVVGGRVRTEQRADGGGWDGYLAVVPAGGAALQKATAVDVERGDVIFDIAPLGGGRMLLAGASAYLQNPAGGSISEEAAPLLAVADAQGRITQRIAVAAGPRHNQLRSLAPWNGDWLLGGMTNGPGTHSADGNPGLLFADGYVRQATVSA
ncbi:MAG TPA: hypothetical protein VEC01_00960 [Noviherbaspirillum sp.]|uniref:hypothetical protein n=1 Tax=Noviherbaspirillum sp. TaxID=1926288 RepID=UPI002D6698FF|nr:hypothetical protein [Noviherbaspirillum sp.]HYD93863.1 hypothetical protein [Noviherbaspirillum sp.]